MNRHESVLERFGGAAFSFVIAISVALLVGWLAGTLLGGDGFTAKSTWYISRAAGITAYVLVSLSTLLGLAMSMRATGRRLSHAATFALHEHLSWLALGFVALHAGVLLLDHYEPFRPVDILLPFISGYRPVSVGLGIITMYLAALLTTSFYVQRRIGHRAWRLLHYASFVVYGAATLHGILAGNSTGEPWMRALYVVSASAVLACTALRLRERRPRTRTSVREGRIPDHGGATPDEGRPARWSPPEPVHLAGGDDVTAAMQVWRRPR